MGLRIGLLAAAVLTASSVNAGVSIPGTGTGTSGELTATNAASLSVQRGGGSGHISIVPYFSTQRGNSTLINVVNTDAITAKVVKVRFRSAGNGDTVFDFTLFLAPADTWAINVSSDGIGGPSFATVTDASCTLPANLNASFFTTRLPTYLDAATRADWTREGLVEIITMADIADRGGALYEAVASSDPAVRRCGNTPAGAAALAALMQDPANEAAARRVGLDTPTTGIRVTSMLINIQNAAISWNTPVTSLTWRDAAGSPARGRLVFSPQTSDTAPNADLFTNDPLLRSVAGGGAGRIPPLQADLPDLSTPYAGVAPNAADAPFRQTEVLARAMQVYQVSNLFTRNSDIAAVTDWTVSQPLRRYAVAVDSSAAAPTLVFNQAPAGPSSYYYNSDTYGARATQLRDGVACNRWGFSTWDSKGEANVSNFVGGLFIAANAVDLCGNVGVVLFDDNAASALKSSVNAVKPIQETTPQAVGSIDGWARIRTLLSTPLPLLGAAYSSARGPVVSGKSTNFGIADNHDVVP